MASFVARLRRALRIVIGGERLRADPLFDSNWYRWANPDAPRSARGAARHYAVVGVDEFRSPSPDFSARRYAEQHPDVAASGLSPLVHFMRFGRGEERTTWSHYERFFADADGRLDREALETYLRSGALTEGRGAVLRAMPHLLHAMPRGKARPFGDILVALANDRLADLGPVLVTGPARGTLSGISVAIVGEPGILSTATLASLFVGAEVGREQIAEPGEPIPEGEVLVEVQAGALVMPGSIGWLAEHAQRGPVSGIALQADGAPMQSWTEDDAPQPPILTATLAESTDTTPPRIVRGAAAVWWPQTPPTTTSQGAASPSGAPHQRPRALVVDASVPTISYASILAALEYRVVFVPQDLRYHPQHTPELESWDVEVVDERYVDSLDEVLAGARFDLAIVIEPAEVAIDLLRESQPGALVLFPPRDLTDHALAALLPSPPTDSR